MKIETNNLGSSVGVIAIHGGPGIEPGTDTCAKLVAGSSLSYCVVVNDDPDTHITSTKYREPEVVEFVRSHDAIVSIHGEKTWEEEFVLVGGLHEELKENIVTAIISLGYEAWVDTEKFPATSPENICNMGSSGKGVQLEMSRGLRHYFWNNEDKHSEFARAIRDSIC